MIYPDCLAPIKADMGLFTRVNGITTEIKNLGIKADGQMGYMDYEDQERMKEVAQMITSDIDQTLQARKELPAKGRMLFEADPLVKDVMEKGDPAAIRMVGTGAIAVLADRWSKMDNAVQRKAEMMMVLAAEGWALKTSMDRGYIPSSGIPPFMITLWGMRF